MIAVPVTLRRPGTESDPEPELVLAHFPCNEPSSRHRAQLLAALPQVSGRGSDRGLDGSSGFTEVCQNLISPGGDTATETQQRWCRLWSAPGPRSRLSPEGTLFRPVVSYRAHARRCQLLHPDRARARRAGSEDVRRAPESADRSAAVRVRPDVARKSRGGDGGPSVGRARQPTSAT